MLNQNKFFENENLVEVIIDEAFINKGLSNKSTNDMNNKIFLELVKEGFVNVEKVNAITLSIYSYHRDGIQEGFTLVYNERLKTRWYRYTFDFTKQFIKDWRENHD